MYNITNFKPRACVVLCLLIEVDVVEFGRKLKSVAHLVEKKREHHLPNAVVELLELGNFVSVKVLPKCVAVRQYVV